MQTSAEAVWEVGGEGGGGSALCQGRWAATIDGDGCREAVDADPRRPTADAGSPYSSRGSKQQVVEEEKVEDVWSMMQILPRQPQRRLSWAGAEVVRECD